jgi:hypothetical protein
MREDLSALLLKIFNTERRGVYEAIHARSRSIHSSGKRVVRL